MQSLGGVLLGSVNVVGGAELEGKVTLVRASGKSNSSVAHLARVLHGKVTKTAETLDRNSFSRRDAHLANAVVHGNAGAHQRSKLSSITVIRKAYSSLASNQAVLGI